LLDAVAGRGGGAAVQRKAAPDARSWRNVVIEGENRVQEVIRAAQRDRKGRVQLELVIEPDLVGVDGHTATGVAPGGKDPDGGDVHRAAVLALRDIADQAPTSRRVVTVVLDRTADGWERSRFALTGEAKPADSKPVPVATGQLELTNALELAHAARHGQVRMDVACSPDGVRILSWRSSGASTATSAAQPSTERVAKAFGELASLAGGRTLVYELRHRLGDAGWEQEAMHLIGEVKPPEAEGDDAQADAGQALDLDHDPDDAQEIVADIKNKRRLVLATAAELIAEQDPTRLDNMIFSLGPLAIVGMVKLKKIARLGKKWKARDIKDEVFAEGCDRIARMIQKQIGGEIVRFKPKTQRVLGPFRGKNWSWGFHEVVVKNGRIYDLSTGHQGLSIDEYKRLWGDADDINFGF
jgi:hypothetical protein